MANIDINGIVFKKVVLVPDGTHEGVLENPAAFTSKKDISYFKAPVKLTHYNTSVEKLYKLDLTVGSELHSYLQNINALSDDMRILTDMIKGTKVIVELHTEDYNGKEQQFVKNIKLND
jgi:hypothetical protein